MTRTTHPAPVQLNLPQFRPVFTDIQSYIIDRWQHGWSITRIAHHLKLPFGHVRTILKKLAYI